MDIRGFQEEFKAKGVKILTEATEGPAYLTIKDPDGKQILLDQPI